MNHFNRAIIWGEITALDKKTTINKTPYLDVRVNCRGPYGRIRAFCRVWGRQQVDEFTAEFQKGSLVRLQGFMGQYRDKKDRIRTNFAVYQGEPWDPAVDEHKERRATFILVGVVKGFEEIDGEGALIVAVTIETEGYGARTEEFEVRVPTEVQLDFKGELAPGRTLRIKGVLAQEEDGYGELKRAARLMAREIEDVGEPAAEAKEQPIQDEVPF